jgi:TRAP-type C4-dicarboxylate transport system substrate-binding protein
MNARQSGNFVYQISTGLAVVLMLFIVTLSPVSAKELKLGHFLSPVHIIHSETLAPWAKKVAELSNGDLTITIFPARQLGGTPPGYYKMVVNGVADIAMVNPGYTPKIFPRTAALELPDPPKNAQHQTRRLYALFDKYLSKEYAPVKMIAMWSVDKFILLTKNKPVRTLGDLKGLKIRTPSRSTCPLSMSIRLWTRV